MFCNFVFEQQLVELYTAPALIHLSSSNTLVCPFMHYMTKLAEMWVLYVPIHFYMQTHHVIQHLFSLEVCFLISLFVRTS